MENITKPVSNETKKFIELKDLTANDVKSWSRFPMRFKKTVSNRGIAASATLILNKENLQISLVSSEQLQGGKSRQLRYFLPDVFVSLIMALDLPEKDERGLAKNDWFYEPAVRFVKGSYKNSDKEYYAVEILFKQFKYHVHFLNPMQLDILNNLIAKNKLIDYKEKPVKVVWEVRPESIDEAETSDREFSF